MPRRWIAYPPRERRAHLYFILNARTGMVKIGVAGSPEDRMHDLQQAAGVPLSMLGVLKNGAEYEQDLHLYFAADRRIGEWFVASARLVWLAIKPRRVPYFLKHNIERLETARARLREKQKAAGIRWRSVALRGME